MARAYSRTQGGFIDIPDVQSEDTSMSLGGNKDNLNKVFALLSLGKKDYKGAYDFLNPEPSESDKKRLAEEEENKIGIEQLLEDLTYAEQQMKESGTGIQYSGSGLRSKLPSWLGGLNKEAAETQTEFSNINTRLFETAGKAFTGPEKALLRGLILDLSNNPETNTSTINQARRILEKKTGKTNTKDSSTSNFDDPLGLFN